MQLEISSSGEAAPTQSYLFLLRFGGRGIAAWKLEQINIAPRIIILREGTSRSMKVSQQLLFSFSEVSDNTQYIFSGSIPNATQ